LLFAAVVEKMPPQYLEKLRRMGEYLDALMGPARRLPFLGDDDGGRFFHPYGEREGFGRASLAACAQLAGGNWEYTREDAEEWAVWLGGAAAGSAGSEAGRASRLFADAGVAAMRAGETQVLMDAGPFGPFGAGHSHADTLSLVVRRGRADVLVDAGTYTYVSEPEWRDRFRGTAAHNTVRIDGLDQGTMAGPFRWSSRPEVTLRRWESSAERDLVDAVCAYGGFRHRRQAVFVKPDWIFVLDTVEGPGGEHRVEQFWHAGEAVEVRNGRRFGIGGAELLVTREGKVEEGWRSTVLGSKTAAPVVKVEMRGGLPMRLGAALDLRGRATGLAMEETEGEVRLRLEGAEGVAARFGSNM